MSTHNLCFYEELRKLSSIYVFVEKRKINYIALIRSYEFDLLCLPSACLLSTF